MTHGRGGVQGYGESLMGKEDGRGWDTQRWGAAMRGGGVSGPRSRGRPSGNGPLLFGRIFACAAVMGLSGNAEGQWTEQSIDLEPGWNSIFLHVQPDPAECDIIFSNVSFAVEQVCTYNSAFCSVQYVQDFGDLTNLPPDWLTWLPATNELASTRNLFTLQCGKPYLVKLPDGAASTNWSIAGRPVLKTIEWREDAYNLVGFQVDDAAPPTFESFFSASPQHAGQPVYRLSTTGTWDLASSPTDTMRTGEAFWIYAGGYSEFQGPLAVETDQRSGLEYGLSLMEQNLRIRNGSTDPVTVWVQEVPAQLPAPDAAQPLRAGDVPLSWWNPASTNGLLGAWEPPLSEQTNALASLQADLSEGEAWDLRLAVRRMAMASFTPPPGEYGDYQGLLEVKSSNGSRIVVPVHALGLVPGEGGTDFASASHVGLWVGSAVINKVNQPAGSTNNPAIPIPVGSGSEFQFRVILHVDTNQAARLLQHVSLMWVDGTYVPDPQDPTRSIMDEPGRYVLVADDSLIGNFDGAALRDGVQVGRRISSAGFGFDQPLVGNTGGTPNTLRFQVAAAFNDPLNPFLHQYHPDHNNLDDRGDDLTQYTNQYHFVTTNFYNEVYTNDYEDVYTRESYTVTRLIELEFTEDDPEGLDVPGWGDNQVGGVWRETITGLRHQPVHSEGVFRLHRASRVGVLNDGL